MSRNYYIFSNGRIKREQNTLYLETAEGRRPVPIEDVDGLYALGELDLNTKLLNFLTRRKVPLHVFNYYGYYAGSYYPREYLNSGFLLVKQVEHYSDPAKRLVLAGELVRGAAHSIERTLAYYQRRKGAEAEESERTAGDIEGGADRLEADIEEEADGLERISKPEDEIQEDALPEISAAPDELRGALEYIADLAAKIGNIQAVDELRGIEGKIRESYYGGWRYILREGPGIEFEKRVRRPPDNMVNSLISFGNGMIYAACLTEIYRTQLTPTISYLHEPGARRYSLALDLSEIFKPIIVDRVIFTLLNTNQLQEKHFRIVGASEDSPGACYLAEEGRRIFVKAFEEKMQTTLYHRRLKRHVSYQRLIRLECYRLIRHLSDDEPYRAFRAWW